MTLQNQEPDITIRLLWDEEFTKWRWKIDMQGEEHGTKTQGLLSASAQMLCSTLDVAGYRAPATRNQPEQRCEGCADQPMPGVRFPASPDGDTTLPWVERCDTCERYSTDWQAAAALAAQLHRGVGGQRQYPDGPSKPFLYPIDKREQ